MDLKRIIEAVLFSSPRPVSAKKLSKKLEISSAEEIEGALNELLSEYNYSERALEIVQVSGGYQLRTKLDYGEWARRFVRERDVDLTRSMLEVLAVIAYKQPVTKSEIDGVRGVDSARAIKNLLDRKLVEVAGRNGNGGRKITFRTTVRFLEVYGLNDLKDLPTVREIESLEL
jgi:segregation and condensation protein B